MAKAAKRSAAAKRAGAGNRSGSRTKSVNSKAMPAKRVPKGELEIGRSGPAGPAGSMAQGTPRASSGRAATGRGTTSGTRKTARGNLPPAPRLPGEKSVRRTKAAVGVNPIDTSREDGDLLPPLAVDRRRQIIGTDDPAGRTTKRAGRGKGRSANPPR